MRMDNTIFERRGDPDERIPLLGDEIEVGLNIAKLSYAATC